jgi:glycogen phosphorylase
MINLFRDLDPIRWRQLDHNPIALLREFTPERLASRAAEMVLYSRINYAHRRLKEYMANKQTWGGTRGLLGAKPVAYFSAEFGIHESIADLFGRPGRFVGRPYQERQRPGRALVAVGLFYDQGYFKQQLDENGYQREEYLDTKVENVPMEPALARGQADHGQTRHANRRAVGQGVADACRPREAVPARLRRRGEQPEDRELTSRLYGGDERTRIRQELVLGVGGVARCGPGHHARRVSSERRAQRLRPLEVDPRADADDGMSFDDALREVARRPSLRRTRRCPPGTTASTAAWSKSTWARCAISWASPTSS